MAGNHWRLAPLRVDSGPNVIVLDGELDSEKLAVNVDATVEQLDFVWPGVTGALIAKVAFSGAWQELRGSGAFEARNAQIGDYSVETLNVAGEAGLAPGTPLTLDIRATGAKRGAIDANDVQVSFRGTTSALTRDARGTCRRLGRESRGERSGSGPHVARLDRPHRVRRNDPRRLAPRRTPRARRRAARGSRSRRAACCTSRARAGAPRLRSKAAPTIGSVFSAQNFDVKTLGPLLPPQLAVDGVYQLSASFFDLSGEPRGAAALTGGTTHVRVAFGREQAFATDLEDFRATATLEAGRLELDAGVTSSNAGSARVNARIDDIGARDSTIAGSVMVHSSDLGFLSLLSPDLGQVAGSLDGTLGIGGTIDAPTVDGRAVWSQGSVAVPEWGLVVNGIQATATSADGRALAFDATGKAGDGELKLTGTTVLDPARGWPTKLELTGKEVQAVQLPDAQIFVSPDLDIDVALPDVRVTGRVLVPRAEIKLSTLPAQAVAPSPDAVVHGDAAGAASRPLRLTASIELALGDAVRYTGSNLETKVSGGLRLDTDANRTSTASGTLTLTGTYNAYGQKLELERGQLLFSGPLDNPGLDVRAARSIEQTSGAAEQVRVGVELVGTVRAPRTRVFSTPAMSESDALSYLLLGRPVTGTGSEETATLQTAAISMGLQQALPGLQRIGQTLGLDEFSVQTTESDEGEVMAGKYLTPNVYIRYSYGLFNRIGGLLLRFKVSERFSIETRSGDQKSMDLLYTVEKD